MAEAPQVVDARGVDRICQSLFFTGRARATDKNLQFVGGHLLNQEDQRRASLLDLYAKVRCGRAAIPDDETSPLCGTLRLSGLVRVVDGRLRVRNRIYRRVFDQRWIRNALPDSEVVRRRRAFRQGAMAAGGLALLLIGLIGASVYFIADRLYFEHISYAKLPIRRFGVFEEFGRLTKEQVRRRPGSFEFSRQGHNGPVTKVRSVNSSFIPIAASSLQTYLDFGLDYELDKPISIPHRMPVGVRPRCRAPGRLRTRARPGRAIPLGSRLFPGPLERAGAPSFRNGELGPETPIRLDRTLRRSDGFPDLP